MYNTHPAHARSIGKSPGCLELRQFDDAEIIWLTKQQTHEYRSGLPANIFLYPCFWASDGMAFLRLRRLTFFDNREYFSSRRCRFPSVEEGLKTLAIKKNTSGTDTLVCIRPKAETQWGGNNWPLSYLNRTNRLQENCSVIFDENGFNWVNWTNVVPVLTFLLSWW